MLSRQTLGRPAMADSFAPINGAESLNARAGLQGGTMMTQFNNRDEDAGAAMNDEIDDLRRD